MKSLREAARMKAPPRVRWETDDDGDEFVDVSEVGGPFWWAQLHAWADNIVEWGCVHCGEEAVKFAHALHDLKNVDLGKPVMYPDHLRETAERMMAAWRQHQHGATVKAEQVPTLATILVAAMRQPRLIPDEHPGALTAFRIDTALVRRPGAVPKLKLSSPADVAAVVRDLGEVSDRERNIALYVDRKNMLIGAQQVSVGTKDAVVIPMDVIVRTAILSNASGVFLIHNHPSGDPEPSDEDLNVTRELRLALSIFDVQLIDHIVIGSEGRFVSIAERGFPTQTAAKFAQLPDETGSRCRDPFTGEWVAAGLCPPIEPGVTLTPEIETSGDTFAFGPNGITRYELRHEILELRDLVVSTDPFTFAPNPDFPPELQPRSRDRAANRVQVQTMAASLEPDLLLTDSHAIDRGSPIVTDAGVVLSGNGRTMALILAQADHPAVYTRYVLELTGFAAVNRIGDAGTSLERPVLVRVLDTAGVDLREFVEEANAPATITQSAIEQARSDADKLTLDLLVNLDVGDQPIDDALRAARNRSIVTSFLGRLPTNEQARLVTGTGELNQDGLRRMVAALFVKALPGDAGVKVAERAIESIDQDVRNVINGLGRALGPMARAEALIADGDRDAGLSLGADIAAAVNVYAKVKRTQGASVTEYLSQSQIFQRELTAYQETLLAFLDENVRSSRRIGAVLAAYAEAVIDQPPPAQTAFFDDARPTKEELWAVALRQAQGEGVLAEKRGGVHAIFSTREGGVLMGGRDPQSLVDWCNVTPEQRDALWSWRALREVLMIGSALKTRTLEVCSAGFTGSEFQVTFDFGGSPTAAAAQETVRKAARRLEPHVRNVPEFATTRVVFEVVLPGEPQDLSFRPQIPDTTPARPDPSLQPALFQTGVRYGEEARAVHREEEPKARAVREAGQEPRRHPFAVGGLSAVARVQQPVAQESLGTRIFDAVVTGVGIGTGFFLVDQAKGALSGRAKASDWVPVDDEDEDLEGIVEHTGGVTPEEMSELVRSLV